MRNAVPLFGIFLALGLASAAAPANAQVLPPGFSMALVVEGLDSPTAMRFAPDGRLFVCEKSGRVRVIEDGTLLPAPFVTLPVSYEQGERGLLGVTFHPGFPSAPYVYLYYTVPEGPGTAVHNRVSRFTANGNLAVPGSEVVIVDLDNVSTTLHNAGALDFGPDGTLFVASGDDATHGNSQSLSTRFGKMLRYNADGSIPPDNPFYASASGPNRAIWAYGLRNPFKFAFNPTGQAPLLLINDVGGSQFEEVNEGLAGANYGYPGTEGYTTLPEYTSPRHAYANGVGGACAITGGAFYSPGGGAFPAAYANAYFFTDFCGGFIRRLDPASNNTVTGFASGIGSAVDLQVYDGYLFYLAIGEGAVYRIGFGAPDPSIVKHPASVTVSPGESATFSVIASGTAPFSYQWLRNDVAIPGATSAAYTMPSPQLGDSAARLRVRVTTGGGTLLSGEAVLTVTTNQAPTAIITQPAASLTYSGGMAVAFAGTGSDPEDGVRPPGALTWRVDFHHGTHVHPFLAPTSGLTSGSFVIPATGETATNVWYRVSLTVTDTGGRSHTVQRDLFPRVVRLTLATSPSTLQVRLDGQPFPAPHSFESVVGVVRSIEAAAQATEGTAYAFDAWSDLGPPGRTIVTPPVDTTYTAVFHATAVSAPPAVPGTLAVITNGQTLHVSWGRSAGATSYRLEVGTGSGLANLFNADLGNAASIQGQVAPGTYFLRVRAVNALGASAPSAQASATISGAASCVTPPPAPSGYSAQTGGLLAALAWAASPGATSYQLEAGSGPGLANLLVSNVGNVTTFGATAGAGTYLTRIRAVNACGVSPPSVEVPVTLGCTAQSVIPAGLTVVKTAGTAVFSWTPPLGALSYRLRVGTAPGAANVADLDVGSGTSLAVSLAGVPPGLYYVRVAALSACGVSAPSNDVAVAVP